MEYFQIVRVRREKKLVNRDLIENMKENRIRSNVKIDQENCKSS